MAVFRSFNDLVIAAIEALRIAQPNLDTKPGTVSRDLFVDLPSQQLANLYIQLRNISSLQSLFASSGTDLNRLASNFGASRRQGTSAAGVAVFTTNNLDVDILIPQGTVVTASNGITFQTTTSTIMSSSTPNVYRANATRLRTDLELATITDPFAVEVTVQALTSGSSGNIGRFGLVTQNVSGITGITNTQTFSGGSNPETDDEFRTRILSIFAGSNTGTALGYTNAIEVLDGVTDSLVVVPGDPLLIRDGTQVVEDTDGNLVVSEPGSGGKVDIYVLGSQLESQIDSFIFNDLSGRNDPTDPDNDYILGQQGEDSTLNAAQRRVELIDNLPLQPVDDIITVVGSSSGPNFVEQFTDDQGRVRGNYILLKDSGDFGGSPFGFDKIRWTSNQIELEDEEATKGTFNGTDSLSFTDVNDISNITQDFLVTNENSTVNISNRKEVYLKHTPVVSVSRIVNVTTGERYIVEDPNPDGEIDDEVNSTGKILISGSTLPVGTDVLQVDYIWRKPFDRVFDFDNLSDINTFRTVQDSIDWGFGNRVVREPATVVDDGYGVLTVTLSHPVFKILSIDSFDTDIATVNSGAIAVNETVTNIIDMKRVSDGSELFNTDRFDGTLSGTSAIILPTDTLAEDGDIVTVRFNAADVFSPDGYDEGTFDGKVVTLDPSVSNGGTPVLATYIANVSTLLSETELSDLPALKNFNQFSIGTTVLGEQPTSNLLNDDGDISTNLRRAASNIRVLIDGTSSNGSIVVSGTTRHKVVDALVVVTSGSGFEVDLQSAIKKDLGVSSLPSDIKLTKLVKFERVNVNSSGVVTSVDNEYDIVNYKLRDNSYDLEVALKDESINYTKIVLPETTDNVEAQLNTADIVRVTFYYIDTDDSELLFFSRNGTRVTDKVFQEISRVSIGSGFKDPAGELEGTIVLSNFNQPTNNTAYSVDYDYVAPKENERITVTYNHNRLINDATTAIEVVRPITADVLMKEAKALSIDVTIRIVLLPEFEDQEQTVVQDSVDAVSSFLTANSLGTTVDASDIVNTLYTVNGIDRVRVLNFSTEDSGNKLSITAERNEYLDAGVVDIVVEER